MNVSSTNQKAMNDNPGVLPPDDQVGSTFEVFPVTDRTFSVCF